MKTQLLIFGLLTLLNIESFSQIVFEKGYFINESYEKTECLIKNKDWRFNPTEFEYKLTQETAIQKAVIDSVKEFGVYGVSKYVRAFVKIDVSSNNNLSTARNPVFQEKELFLKVLVEGKASLFFYGHKDFERFFFQTDSSQISQLIFKSYLVNQNNIGYNYYFKQQLQIALQCSNITKKDVEFIGYNKYELKRLFIKYNECKNSSYINYNSRKKKDLFHLSIRAGLNYSSLEIHSPNRYIGNVDFGKGYHPRLGLEAELFFPFNKNKWSVFIEPTYQYYFNETSQEASNLLGNILIGKSEYTSIELPIGFRHHFYLSEESQIYADFSIVFDYNINSTIELLLSNGAEVEYLEMNSRMNFAGGIGYKYKNRYSLEIRYLADRYVLSDYVYWTSDYHTISLIFGCNIF